MSIFANCCANSKPIPLLVPVITIFFIDSLFELAIYLKFHTSKLKLDTNEEINHPLFNCFYFPKTTAQTTYIMCGKLLDTKSGEMLTKQTIVVKEIKLFL